MKKILGIFIFIGVIISFQSFSGSKPSNEEIYLIDVENSTAEWCVFKHFGMIDFKSGSLLMHNDELVGGEFIFDMNSIIDFDIDYEFMRMTLQNVLKSEDCFNTKIFPESHFIITGVEKIDSINYHLTGDLTIFDITNEIDFDIIREINESYPEYVSDVIVFDRTKWGFDYLSEGTEIKGGEMVISNFVNFVVRVVVEKKKNN